MRYEQGMGITHVHVAIEGEGRDIVFEELDCPEFPTVAELKTAVEQHLELEAGLLRNYECDGYETTGQVVLHPDSKLGDTETDIVVRTKVMDSLLRCPHREMDQILGLHTEMMKEDPEFYAHLAVWAMEHTKVRDHQEAFIATLFSSEYPEFREVAYVLMQDLPPYQIARLRGHVQGEWVGLNVRVNKKSDKATKAKAAEMNKIKKALVEAREKDPETDLAPFYAPVRKLFGLKADVKMRARLYKRTQKVLDKKTKQPTGESRRVQKVKFEYFRVGVMKNAPRVMRAGVKSYLRLLEMDGKRMGSATVRQFHALKKLYGGFHLKPGEEADLTLFKDAPPDGSKRLAMKDIAKITDPMEWAKSVVAENLPFPVAIGLCTGGVTPVHLIALINQMSPQELLSNMKQLEERGAMDNPDVKKLIEDKLGKASKNKRVDTLKAQKAAEAVEGKVDEGTREKLKQVTDDKVAQSVKIKRNTVLAIDASSSMNLAIDLGKEIGSLVAPCCQGKFMCVVFNSMPRRIDVASDKKSDWDTALKYVKAQGRTNMGSVIQMMERDDTVWEQIVIVTDEGDNGTPKFGVALERYQEKTGVHPNVVLIRCKSTTGVAHDQVERGLKAKDVEVDVFDLSKTDKIDYYSLPNILPLLAKGSRTELLMDIMDLKLPSRSEWDQEHLSA